MTTAKVDLKPCPFCGKKRHEIELGGSYGQYTYYIYCGKCKLRMEFASKKTLIEHWNKRVESSDVQDS